MTSFIFAVVCVNMNEYTAINHRSLNLLQIKSRENYFDTWLLLDSIVRV